MPEVESALHEGTGLSVQSLQLLEKHGIKVEVINALKEIVVVFGDVIIETIRATQANPLMGITVAIMMVNIAKRANFIDPKVELVLLGLLGTAGGIDLFKEALSIIPGEGKGIDIIRPTPTTLTNAQGVKDTGKKDSGQQTLDAVLGTVMKLIPAVVA